MPLEALEQLPDEEIRRLYNDEAREVQVGLSFYRDELQRRNQDRQTRLIVRLTRIIMVLTAVVTIATIVNLVIAITAS